MQEKQVFFRPKIANFSSKNFAINSQIVKKAKNDTFTLIFRPSFHIFPDKIGVGSSNGRLTSSSLEEELCMKSITDEKTQQFC